MRESTNGEKEEGICHGKLKKNSEKANAPQQP